MKIDIRTFFISVIFMGAIIGLALGPLTPPPGPVAPTGPSLAELEAAVLGNATASGFQIVTPEGDNQGIFEDTNGTFETIVSGSGVLRRLLIRDPVFIRIDDSPGKTFFLQTGVGNDEGISQTFSLDIEYNSSIQIASFSDAFGLALIIEPAN